MQIESTYIGALEVADGYAGDTATLHLVYVEGDVEIIAVHSSGFHHVSLAYLDHHIQRIRITAGNAAYFQAMEIYWDCESLLQVEFDKQAIVHEATRRIEYATS